MVGATDGVPVLVDRRRVELVEEAAGKAPYHAAEEMDPAAARALVERCVKGAHRRASKEMRAAVERERDRGNHVVGCAVLMGSAMPDWTTEEILAVHFRMHKAEGMLFKTALAEAAGTCGLKLIEVPDKTPAQHASKALGTTAAALTKKVAALGQTAGPPWGKDQKEASMAALIALRVPGRGKR